MARTCYYRFVTPTHGRERQYIHIIMLLFFQLMVAQPVRNQTPFIRKRQVPI
jgi:hypothetical protein